MLGERPVDLEARRIVALGLTWQSHAKETGEKISPGGPARFARDPGSLCRDGRVILPSRARIVAALDAIEPGVGTQLRKRHPSFPVLFDYEIELAFTVTPNGKLGWFLANDLTVRTVQILGEGSSRRMDFWGAAKSFPSTLLVGPAFVLSDDVPDVELVLRVQGDTRQRARSTDLMYSVTELRRYAGPLETGDVVLTGTPAGIALAVPKWKRAIADVLFDRWRKLDAAFRAAARSTRFLHAGDVIEMDAGFLGSVRCIVEEELEASP